jgi:hypothetical protein
MRDEPFDEQLNGRPDRRPTAGQVPQRRGITVTGGQRHARLRRRRSNYSALIRIRPYRPAADRRHSGSFDHVAVGMARRHRRGPRMQNPVGRHREITPQ